MYTEAEREMVLSDLAKGRTLQRISRNYGLAPKVVREIAGESKTSKFTVHSEDGLGRPKLRPFIIASRHVHEPWPENEEIRKAQLRYDAGMSEICTGRDGDYQILYEIPRKQTEHDRTPYFTLELGEE